MHAEYDETRIERAAAAALWPGTYCLRFIIIKTLLTWAIKHLIGLAISFLFGFARFFFNVTIYTLHLYEFQL